MRLVGLKLVYTREIGIPFAAAAMGEIIAANSETRFDVGTHILPLFGGRIPLFLRSSEQVIFTYLSAGK